MSSGGFIGKTVKSFKKTVGRTVEDFGIEDIAGGSLVTQAKFAKNLVTDRGTKDAVLNKGAFAKNVKESGISDATKTEILDLLKTTGRFEKQNLEALNLFRKAQEGTDPKFKSRMATQARFESLVDRPDAQRLRGNLLDFNRFVRR
jgi:hypothetical protein